MMFASSHTCNLSPERPSMVHMQFHQMVQGLMWQQMVLGWSFWARLFWRQSPLAQSNSQSYTLSLPAIISKKMQKKNGHNYEQRMREIEQGSFTPLVAPIHHWRNGSSCHSVLQEACLNDVPEAGLTIFKNHVLAEMLPQLCPPLFIHPMLERCMPVLPLDSHKTLFWPAAILLFACMRSRSTTIENT